MEGGTFHREPMAGLLREGFVESRLHFDDPARIDPKKWPVHHVLRAELIGEATMPYYAILDPRSGAYLGKYRLQGGNPSGWDRDIETFLRKAKG